MNNSERIKRDIYDLYEIFYSIGKSDYESLLVDKI
ncbi:hypothetical protein C817_00002 [Dorea sp. 5-2]|nr:hypothetical protein C817_00002 [Dorea sp. 5-2]